MRPLSTRPLIRPLDVPEATRLRGGLADFESAVGPLRGLTSQARRDVLVAQIIESERRSRYIAHLREAELSDSALNPASGAFDPIKAAVLMKRAGDYDEACWLVLLSVHFGRHLRHDWELAAHFYGRLGQGGRWDWAQTSTDVEGVRLWLDLNRDAIRARGAGFGNHRKYESLRGRAANGTGVLIATYVNWVGPSHAECFADVAGAQASSADRFAALYASMDSVIRFGRTARFDYLTMLGKLGLAEVEPDNAHLVGSTGPQKGARLLLEGISAGSPAAKELEAKIQPLQERLGIRFDVLEDALCNWQKCPNSFVAFRG